MVQDLMFRLALIEGERATPRAPRAPGMYTRSLTRLAIGTTLLVCLGVSATLRGASMIEPFVQTVAGV